MSLPFFSILIANYNNGKYLMEAINSVRKQTYASWEIILVDDGSTDGSMALYEQLTTDTRIHIYHNDCNRGCGYTKRRCVEEAHSEWCAFLDPDDTIREDALDIFAQNIALHPQYGVFFSHMYICDEKMNVIYDSTYKENSQEWNTFIHYQRGIHLYCFNKGVYLSTAGIHQSLPQSVDIDLYYKMSEVTSAYYIDKPLYYYRNNPISLTKDSVRATSTHLWVMLESLKRQKVSEQDIWKEMEDFWKWRTEPLYQELKFLQKDKYYQFGQYVKKIKRTLKKYFG